MADRNTPHWKEVTPVLIKLLGAPGRTTRSKKLLVAGASLVASASLLGARTSITIWSAPPRARGKSPPPAVWREQRWKNAASAAHEPRMGSTKKTRELQILEVLLQAEQDLDLHSNNLIAVLFVF